MTTNDTSASVQVNAGRSAEIRVSLGHAVDLLKRVVPYRVIILIIISILATVISYLRDNSRSDL